MRKILSSLILVGLFATPCFATDPCSQLPDIARQYLKDHPGWHILGLDDLSKDDQALWSQYRKGVCPGMAEVDFDGSGGKFVALALVDHSNATERVVAIRPVDHSLEAHTLVADFPAYNVIWRAGPGVAKEWDSDKKTRIRHDSLIVEQMESAAQQYYWKHGRFRYVQISD